MGAPVAAGARCRLGLRGRPVAPRGGGGEEAESPPRHKRSPGPGWRRGRREWARRGRGAAGSLETREAACGWASPRGRSPRVGSGPTQSSGQPSCWRVTPLSVAATGGGGTVGNPETRGLGGGVRVILLLSHQQLLFLVFYVRCCCSPSQLGGPSFSLLPHHPRTATSPSPVVSYSILSPTSHPLLLGQAVFCLQLGERLLMTGCLTCSDPELP